MAATQNDSTRVFVSGLPPTLTSDQLASHFKKQYQVTDAHVFSDRRIGFIGFHDHDTAQNAVKFFNRSYIRMSKISVDLARPVEVNQNSSGQAVPVSQRGVHQHPRKKPMNLDDSQAQAGSSSVSTPDSPRQTSQKRKRDANDDGERMRMANGDSKAQRNTVTASPHAEEETIQETLEPEAADDNDWLRGKTSRLLDLVELDEQRDVPAAARTVQDLVSIPLDEDAIPPTESDPAEIESPQRRRVPNARLFLRNLAFDITDDDLESKFAQFGKVQEAHIVKDTRKSTSKGMAFVQFSDAESAETAMQTMDGVAFHGRLLHILPASDKREQGLTDFDISKMPLKKQKAVRRKLEAGNATFSWNSLYMNPDAVVSSIADRLGVSKSEILDPTSADAAVKQAHAETQLIAETKNYLRSQGINIDAFKVHARDDRSLLLKNFSYGTTEGELKDLLQPFGEISRFMIPPAGTMALVQFVEPFSATQALKGLAYKNIKGSVLYLEKAPQGLIGTKTSSITESKVKADVSTLISDTNDTTTGTTATVFVRNLNFSTTTSRLTEVFSPLSGFLSARVKTRTDPKRPNEILSMGFGFVEFGSLSSAQAAVVAMNGHRLDAHELIVKLSNKATDLGEERRRGDLTKKNDANKTKIIIKNLPFQTSRKDIRSLFTQYGQLKTVRVPKKFDNSSRGFGFAEFVTAKEAQSAVEALSNTHLLGRRLVLEFAQEEAIDPEEEIKAIERKIEQQSNRVNLSRLTGGGRKKFNVDTGDEDHPA